MRQPPWFLYLNALPTLICLLRPRKLFVEIIRILGIHLSDSGREFILSKSFNEWIWIEVLRTPSASFIPIPLAMSSIMITGPTAV